MCSTPPGSHNHYTELSYVICSQPAKIFYFMAFNKFYSVNNSNNNNSNLIYKAPKAVASEALVAGQSWVLLKSFMEEVRLKPRFKDSQ